MLETVQTDSGRAQSTFDREVQKTVTSIIQSAIPQDSEARVIRAYKQWNQIIREHIRNETALKLSDGDGRFSIQVRIVDGFPRRLAELINEHPDPVLWLLILNQSSLAGITGGLQLLLNSWPELEGWNRLPSNASHGIFPLSRTLEIVEALQEVAIAETLRKQIRDIHEDVLGAYLSAAQGKRIELYWMPIAMVAGMLDVKIEDLTLVVLAHELAHGYTHLGHDIEGSVWSDDLFRQTDDYIIEGLAQFYTEAVMDRLASRTPGPKVAFERLLTLQSGPYRIHQDWLEGSEHARGEAVRFTLISARRQKHAVNYNTWLNLGG